MKRMLFLLGSSMLFMWNTVAYATFTSGSTGADGPFNPVANIEVVLPPDGVLNYTTVNIPPGVTVTFKKNAANTPVFMLATGDVTIAGTINVSGSNATSTAAGKGGIGGFGGGFGGGQNLSGGKGLGPGGGNPGAVGTAGAGGGFGANGDNYSSSIGGVAYGNQRLLPLVGGSGGGGGGWRNGQPGGNAGGGGGAVVIASSTFIEVTGSIAANGGKGVGKYDGGGHGGGGGSGGAIKLIASEIRGGGTLTARGGPGDWSASGGVGRIRIETYANKLSSATDPPFTYGLPTSVFPASPPSLSITSIAGTVVPTSPTGAYNQPDMLLPSTTTNPVTVDIAAEHIPVGTTVKVWVLPQYGSATSVSTTLSGTNESSTAAANVNLSTAYSNVVAAEATFTILQAMYWNGEEIDKVKVATRMGGDSETVYITTSGKEIPAELIAGVYR